MTPAELAADLAGAAARSRPDMSAAIWGAAVITAREQRNDLQPGRYTSSVAASIRPSGEDGTFFRPGVDLTAEAGPTSPLAPLIEFGNANSGPRPFVYQGVDRVDSIIVRSIADAVDL